MFVKLIQLTTVADRIIIILALILLIWLYTHYWIGGQQPAEYALIFVANQSPIRVDLQYNQQIPVQGYLGKSLIEVSEGRIRFVASPCRTRQCIHAGWLTNGGDFVACLPNQVSIELHHTESTDFDSIVY